MDIIRFSGKDKKESAKRAMMFFHDNLSEIMKMSDFLAKCRLQSDQKTIFYYHKMDIEGKMK